MTQLLKRLQIISAIAIIIGALIKIFHLHSFGDYLLFAGFFASGATGILGFWYFPERNFNSYAKLAASAVICVAIVIDLTFATHTFPFAIILLAISFFSSVMPRQKIPK
jgi:hypothetical protein